MRSRTSTEKSKMLIFREVVEVSSGSGRFLSADFELVVVLKQADYENNEAGGDMVTSERCPGKIFSKPVLDIKGTLGSENPNIFLSSFSVYVGFPSRQVT